MKLLAVLAWIAAMVALPVSAQPVYRCGSTYSQTPCPSAESKPVRLGAVAAPDKPAGALAGKALCIVEAQRLMGLNERELTSVSVVKAPAAVIKYADQPMVAHQFLMQVNGRAYLCFLSEDEHRVLKFATPWQHASDSATPTAGGPTGISSTRPNPVTPYDSIAADRAKRDAEEASTLRATMRGAQRIDPRPTPR